MQGVSAETCAHSSHGRNVHGSRLVADPVVQGRDELDEGLVEQEADSMRDPGAVSLEGAADGLLLPRVQGRVEGPAEPAHPVDVAEELDVAHGGYDRLPTMSAAAPLKHESLSRVDP